VYDNRTAIHNHGLVAYGARTITFWSLVDMFNDESTAIHVTVFSPMVNIPVFSWYTVMSSSAMSVMSGGISVTDATLTGTAEVTTMAGRVFGNEGGVLSITTILSVQVALFPPSSTTVQRTVRPWSNFKGLAFVVRSSEASALSRGMIIESDGCGRVNFPLASTYVGSLGEVHSGGIVSATRTARVVACQLPALSVAFTTTFVMPEPTNVAGIVSLGVMAVPVELLAVEEPHGEVDVLGNACSRKHQSSVMLGMGTADNRKKVDA